MDTPRPARATGAVRQVEIGGSRIRYLLGDDRQFVQAAAALDADRWLLLANDQPRLAGFLDRIAGRLAASAPVERIVVPDGEVMKSLETVELLCSRIVSAGGTRASVIVAVGGGNVSNIAGLCAALLFRGIRLVQVPTTLIGMSDVVLSLKQGVNIAGVKNGLGTYYQPELIWAETATLDTLPAGEIRAGQAEIIKNALVLAPAQIPALRRLLREDARYTAEELGTFIDLAIAAKSLVLRTDAKERRVALVLEYGHTVAHALEVLANGTLSHGLAVGFGIRVAARVARRLGLLDDEVVGVHDELVAKAGLPTALPEQLAQAAGAGRLAAQLARDNKRGYLRLEPSDIPMVLLSSPGVPATTGGLPLTGVPTDLVVSAFWEIFSADDLPSRPAGARAGTR
jgi:2-deoxy-scyllo-inosose synthase